MSDQATAGSETEESAQVPSDHQGTQYDDKTLVKQLLEACSNNKEEYNFEDYVVEKGRGLEDHDVHPKTTKVLHQQLEGRSTTRICRQNKVSWQKNCYA